MVVQSIALYDSNIAYRVEKANYEKTKSKKTQIFPEGSPPEIHHFYLKHRKKSFFLKKKA